MRSWQRRQVVWMLVLTVVAAPTCDRSLELWQPGPELEQPALGTSACAVELASAWMASVPVWQAAQALVVSLADQLLVIAVVDAELLWQLRQLLALPVLADVASACSAVSDEPEVRMSWQAPHAVDANVVALACVEAVGWCLAASVAWACVVAV